MAFKSAKRKGLSSRVHFSFDGLDGVRCFSSLVEKFLSTISNSECLQVDQLENMSSCELFVNIFVFEQF